MLGELQALELDAVGVDVSEVVMRLLCEPACGATAEDLRQPHSHFGRNPPFAVHEFRHVTPSAAAASVMLNPNGSMHCRRTTPPGWGGFFIGMCGLLSVIVNVVHVQRLAFGEAKDNPPVGANGYRPEAF